MPLDRSEIVGCRVDQVVQTPWDGAFSMHDISTCRVFVRLSTGRNFELSHVDRSRPAEPIRDVDLSNIEIVDAEFDGIRGSCGGAAATVVGARIQAVLFDPRGWWHSFGLWLSSGYIIYFGTNEVPVRWMGACLDGPFSRAELVQHFDYWTRRPLDSQELA